MALIQGAFQAINRGDTRQNISQDISFDSTTLPVVVAEHIASFLNGKDLMNLGKTCKFWNEISRNNIVWKILIERRFGRQAVSENENPGIHYRGLYFKLATSKKPATSFDVSWLNGHYLQKAKDRESTYGEVLQLNSVCWLQINQFFVGVLPGKYALVWRMKLDGVYLNSRESIEFRARPEEGCGRELCSKWTERDLKRAERRYGRRKWFEQNMGIFELKATCKVYVEIKGRIYQWCGGISWDYAELRLL